MCSYCGCRESVSIIGRFSEEHDIIVNAMGEVRRALAAATGDVIAARCAELRTLLDPHTASEERSLFAELRAEPEFTDVVDGLCAEHATLDAMLTRIAEGEHALFDTFERMLHAHIDKEENGLFPAAIMALDGERWNRAIANA